MENFWISNEYLIRLSVAMLLGMILGVERVFAHKTAGMRTYALVAMGSALFVIISEMLFQSHGNTLSFDPTRLAAQIISGVGFLGAGLIIFKDEKLMGLTTATGIWVSAGIGMASGFGLIGLAVVATILTLFIFIALWYVEQSIKKAVNKKEVPQNLAD